MIKDCTIRCNNCYFNGEEDSLEKVVEFKEYKDSKVQYLTLSEFNSKYNSLDDVFEYELIDACPNCLTDAYLIDIDNKDIFDIETVLEYKDVTVYHLYKDFESKDSVYEYHYTIDPNDTEGFDIRELATYNNKLSTKENLKLAIDMNLL